MEPIDGDDYLFILCVHSCVLLLVVFLVLYLFIVGSVGCVYTCGLIIDWAVVCICVLACLYHSFFCVLCVVVVGYGALALNQDIVKFRCREVICPFAHPFVKRFLFL